MSPAYEKRVAILTLQFFSFTVASTMDTDDQDIMEAVELLESQHEQSQRSNVYQEAEPAPEPSCSTECGKDANSKVTKRQTKYAVNILRRTCV